MSFDFDFCNAIGTWLADVAVLQTSALRAKSGHS